MKTEWQNLALQPTDTQKQMRVSEWERVLRFCILPLCLMLNHRKMVILVSFKVFKIFFTFLCRRKKLHTIVCRFSIFSQRGLQLIQSCHEKLIEWFHSDDGSSMNGRCRQASAGHSRISPLNTACSFNHDYASCSFPDTRVRLFF